VAIGGERFVAAVHDDGDGELWSWTGEYLASGSVRWLRRAHYDTGLNPAIAIDEDGFVVEVHENPDRDRLFYRVGRIAEGGDIAWMSTRGISLAGAGGINPRVEISGGVVRVAHVSRSGRATWHEGQLNQRTGTVYWTSAGEGDILPDLDEKQARRDGKTVRVFTGADGGFDSSTLLYSTDRLRTGRVRPEQLAFVEVQHGNKGALAREDLLFYSGPARDLSVRIWAVGKRAAGKVARLWCFNDAELTNEASVDFPATDLPFSGWYRGYGSTIGCAR
jgi:hypothetical protein